MTDYTFIVDQFRRRELALTQHWPFDPAAEATRFSTIAKLLGRDGEHHALVHRDDPDGLNGYARAGFHVHSMNGDRAAALSQFIDDVTRRLRREPPRDLVVVTDDPDFRFLLANVPDDTRIALWVPGSAIPPLLRVPHFNPQPLEELLPEAKVPRIDVRLDYENLHLGLVARGWNGDVRAFVRAVRDAFETTGEVVRIVAYADYDLLRGSGKRNWQRELEEAGVETRYLVNERGKNTADMKIADSVRDLLEAHTGPGEAIDVIVLGSNDRDFKTVIETARQKGKQIKLLAIRGGLSHHLSNVVPGKDVLFIDDFLSLRPTHDRPDPATPPADRPAPHDSDNIVVARIAAWLAGQGERGWRFAPTEVLAEALALNERDLAQVEKAVAAGKLRRGSMNGPNGRRPTLGIETAHPVVKAVQQLIHWAPSRISYCLNDRGMPYVDTPFLARGMQMDRRLAELGVGQTPREAEAWLRLLVKAGVLAHREQPHPRQPDRRINTWWPSAAVPAMAAAPDVAPLEAAPPAEATPPEAAVASATAAAPSPTAPAPDELGRPQTTPHREWDPFRLRGSLAYAGRPAVAGLAGAAAD